MRRGDVLAAWSGIRPLVTDPKSADTQSISRNHVVDVSESGLITIAGMGYYLVFGVCFRQDPELNCHPRTSLDANGWELFYLLTYLFNDSESSFTCHTILVIHNR